MRRERFGSSGVAAAADGSSGAGPAVGDQSEGRACVRAGAQTWRAHLRGYHLSARSEWAGASPCPYPYAIVPWHIARRHGHAHCHSRPPAEPGTFNVATARTAPIGIARSGRCAAQGSGVNTGCPEKFSFS